VIVDASAMITVVLEEPGFETYLDTLLRSPANRMSAATFLEAAIVVDRLPNPRASIRFNELISELEMIIEPVSVEQARIAREAHSRFGRGTGHPARLNFGDCFAYALAKDLDEPLLFIGQDFVHTDIRPALDDA
jgi:ribonuclease VapC